LAEHAIQPDVAADLQYQQRSATVRISMKFIPRICCAAADKT
jgi:hypothetical protein